MSHVKVITGKKHTIKVVNTSHAGQKKYISARDAEMDIRVSAAVRTAVKKAVICKKPVARYDAFSKKVYVEYTDGVKKYVE